MRRCAFTLIELILAMTILGLVGLIGGKLLTVSLDRWQQDAERHATERFATAALHRLGEDLQTQINLLTWPDPFAADWATGTSGEILPLFSIPMGRDAPVAVAWILEGNPGQQTLWRLEASEAETRAALPDNAALVQLKLGQDGEADVAAILQSLDARQICRRVGSLEIHPIGDGFQLLLEVGYPGQSAYEDTSVPVLTYVAKTHVRAPVLK